jgi:hypothetical protein
VKKVLVSVVLIAAMAAAVILVFTGGEGNPNRAAAPGGGKPLAAPAPGVYTFARAVKAGIEPSLQQQSVSVCCAPRAP